MNECVMVLQDGDKSRDWVWVPYTCYYHYYSKADMAVCANRTGLKWLHAAGDSQQREFIAHLKMVHLGDAVQAAKFEQVWVDAVLSNDTALTSYHKRESLKWGCIVVLA